MKRTAVSKFFELPAGTLFYIPHYTGLGASNEYSPLFVKGENFPPRPDGRDEHDRHVVMDQRCNYHVFGVEGCTGKVQILDCSSYVSSNAALRKGRPTAPETVYGSPYVTFLILDESDVLSLAKLLDGHTALVQLPVAKASKPTVQEVTEHRRIRHDTHVDRIHNTVPIEKVRYTHRQRPIHPSEILREEFMTPLGLGVEELAHRIGMSASEIYSVLASEAPVSSAMALRLEHFFGTTADFWINLQKDYELRCAYAEPGASRAIHGIVPWPKSPTGVLVPRK